MKEYNNENFSVIDWIGTFLIMLFPIINLIFLLIWAFGDEKEPRKSFSKAYLILLSILIILSIFISLVGLISESNQEITNWDESVDISSQHNISDIEVIKASFEKSNMPGEVAVIIDSQINSDSPVQAIRYAIELVNNEDIILLSTENTVFGKFSPGLPFRNRIEVDTYFDFDYEGIDHIFVYVVEVY